MYPPTLKLRRTVPTAHGAASTGIYSVSSGIMIVMDILLHPQTQGIVSLRYQMENLLHKLTLIRHPEISPGPSHSPKPPTLILLIIRSSYIVQE
jgi:hypothetical protein